MKFQCGSCSTGYSVPDEKIQGKRVRIKCRRCGAPIIIDGPGAPAPGRPAPKNVGQKTRIGGLQAPGTPSVPGATSAAPAPSAAARPSAQGASPALRAAPAPSKEAPATGRQARGERWTVAVSRDNPQKMTTEEVVQAFGAGRIDDTTLIWRKGMTGWKPPFHIAPLALALREAGFEKPAPIKQPAPAAAAAFDDENEETAVFDPTAHGPKPRAAPPRPGVQAGPPKSVEPSAPAEANASFGAGDEAPSGFSPGKAHQMLAPASSQPAKPRPPPLPKRELKPTPFQGITPTPASRPSGAPIEGAAFDDEEETTSVLDPERAQELLKRQIAKEEAPPSSSEFDDEVITQVIDPDRAHKLLKDEGFVGEEQARPANGGNGAGALTGDDEEEDLAKPATEQAAQALLRKSETPSQPPPKKDEPTVVVSDESTKPKKQELARNGSTANAVQLAIQNEPTRIIRVRNRRNRLTLVVAILLVAVASAAGGFLASRFLAPQMRMPNAGTSPPP